MGSNIETLTIHQPDDWHIHLRDGVALTRTVNDAAKQFNRVIVMPNLVPPVLDAAQATDYRSRILKTLEPGNSLDPLMVLYLTDNTDARLVEEASSNEFVHAFKWYPAGATTNSDSGVTSLEAIYPALEAMQKHGMTLLVHGEVTHSEIDIFDREARFIDDILSAVVRDFPELRIVFEHITTKDAADFVISANENIGATITAHHLLLNRNDMLVGGIRPHNYCLPILKRSIHQQALLNAATGDNPRFFLGTDSAPHPQHAKEAACGCAGIYTAPYAIELYAQAFESQNALDKLDAFASQRGPDFYGLPRNTGTITLRREENTVATSLSMGDSNVVPLLAGETIRWTLNP